MDKEVNEGSDRYVGCLCPPELGIGADAATSLSVAMINDIPRRRTNPNVHGGKRKIPPKLDRWSIFA